MKNVQQNGLVLLFHMNIFKASKISDLCLEQNLNVRICHAEDETVKLGELAGMTIEEQKVRSSKLPNKNREKNWPALTEEILIFSGLSDTQLDDLLALLKQRSLSVSLKAVLTPHNYRWTARQLCAELTKERTYYKQVEQGVDKR